MPSSNAGQTLLQIYPEIDRLPTQYTAVLGRRGQRDGDIYEELSVSLPMPMEELLERLHTARKDAPNPDLSEAYYVTSTHMKDSDIQRLCRGWTAQDANRIAMGLAMLDDTQRPAALGYIMSLPQKTSATMLNVVLQADYLDWMDYRAYGQYAIDCGRALPEADAIGNGQLQELLEKSPTLAAVIDRAELGRRVALANGELAYPGGVVLGSVNVSAYTSWEAEEETWNRYHDELAARNDHRDTVRRIVETWLNGSDILNVKTGELYMPDWAGDDDHPKLYGLNTYTLDPKSQIEQIVANGYDSAATWAYERIPAAGTGVFDRMGFISTDQGLTPEEEAEFLIDAAEELVNAFSEGWGEDCPEAVAALVENWEARGYEIAHEGMSEKVAAAYRKRTEAREATRTVDAHPAELSRIDLTQKDTPAKSHPAGR